MKITTMDHQVSEKESVEQDQNNAPQRGAVSDRVISQLFQAYFNNKMTLLLFLIQARIHKPSPRLVEGVSRFLDDLYHHMLNDKDQEEYYPALEWLKSFCREVPDVSQEERQQAKGFVRGLYHAMGMSLKANI